MTTWHISLGFNTNVPNPPNPNPNEWTGSLQYGYCEWNGVQATEVTQSQLPEVADQDTINFFVYQLGGTTTAPSTSGMGSDETWLTVSPVSPTPSTATVFYVPLSTVQNASLAQFGTAPVYSAVFDGEYPCWMLTADGVSPLDCIADNPNGTDGPTEEFSLVFQINVGGSTYGVDPDMIVKP